MHAFTQKTSLSLIALSMASISMFGHAELLSVQPVSYSFDEPTSNSAYDYSDRGGVQLTDGELGADIWSDDAGQGKAYEWVGWLNAEIIEIDFTFDGLRRIDEITIDTSYDNNSNIYFPNIGIQTLDDNSQWQTASAFDYPIDYSDHGRYTISLDELNLQASTIKIQVLSVGPWTFIDEISFFQTSENNALDLSYLNGVNNEDNFSDVSSIHLGSIGIASLLFGYLPGIRRKLGKGKA